MKTYVIDCDSARTGSVELRVSKKKDGRVVYKATLNATFLDNVNLKEVSDEITKLALGVYGDEKFGVFTEGPCEFRDAEGWAYEPDFAEIGINDDEDEDEIIASALPGWPPTLEGKEFTVRLAACLNYLAEEIDCGVDFEAFN